jgi:hypothetical protein
MENDNMQENQRIGITSAAQAIGWPVGRFAQYYYRKLTPEATIVDNQPIWNMIDLINWRDTYPFRKKGRPRKAP